MRRPSGNAVTSFRYVLLLALLAVSPSTSALDDNRQGPEGGGFELDHVQHLTEAQRQQIRDRLEASVAELRERGILPATPTRMSNPPLVWPLRLADGLNDPGYHGVSNFVDQDADFPGSLLDYDCGARTYDTTGGYNHQGIDYFSWPFPYLKMDDSEVEIVAAAAGTILGKDDGNYDRNCAFNSSNWNAVYVMHADGSIAWYGHMKNGTPTTKGAGESVEQGEYLGIVGSSGNSTGPHLHFEVYDSEGALNEPYQGACNGMNANSWWADQRPYYDSAVNHLSTAYAPPEFADCPPVESETTNERSEFIVGEAIYFVTYYRDQRLPQTSNYTIYRPDGSVWTSWSHNSDTDHYAASYWYWWWSSFAPTGPTGIWRFEVEFDGQTYQHLFRLNSAVGSGWVPGQLDDPVPLTAAWDGSQITLDWDASCVAGDVDYEIYEGSIGDWYSHAWAFCSTAGATAMTFTPDESSSYYVVVPTDLVVEGSYGFDSAFAERPQGSDSCLPQAIGGRCPGCGDGIREDPEVCDGLDLGIATCQTLGFEAGVLACNASCDGYDTSRCATCGNNRCEAFAGEDCLSCPSDCNGVQGGNPSSRYCCGDGDGDTPVTCGDPRCFENGNTCAQ